MRFFRFQKTEEVEHGPDYAFESRKARPIRPADPDWPGYWWADADYTHNILIREEDVIRAKANLKVKIYVPGLLGAEDVDTLFWQIADLYKRKPGVIAVYVGSKKFDVWSGVCFLPTWLEATFTDHDEFLNQELPE